MNQHKTDYIEHLSSAGHMSNRDKELFATNRDDVVFIFVDLQEGLIRKSKTMEPNALSSNTAGLAQVAHAISAPALFLPFLRRLRKVSHCQNSRDMQMTVIPFIESSPIRSWSIQSPSHWII